MQLFDIKSIVKESLREAFYTKKEVLSESLNGKKMSIEVYNKWPSLGIPFVEYVKYPAFLGKNVIPNEKPYRLTWFSADKTTVEGHIDMSFSQFTKLMDGQPDTDVYSKITQYIEADRIHVNLYDDEEEPDEEPMIAEGDINGQRLTVRFEGEVLPAVLSRNTIPHEKPYRITVISQSKPKGHIELTKEEAEELLQNFKLPDDVIAKWGSRFQLVKIHENINKNELLLLLEDSAREIDLWLENKIPIEESMNMIVSGANYKRTDRLDELVSHLQDTVVSPILRTITDKAQIDFFQKNSVGFWDMLSADGSYYEKTEGNPGVGIINFYIAGISTEMKRHILLGILKQLKSLNIKWGKLKQEKSKAYKISDVIRIPIDVNNSKEYEGPAQLNFSNVNAYQIFHNILQYEGEHSFQMDAKDLMERIETVLKHDRTWIEKNVINKTDTDWPDAERIPQDIDNPHMDVINQLGGDSTGGPRMISNGLDSEGIEFRLGAIWNVARWAVEHGHSKISVG